MRIIFFILLESVRLFYLIISIILGISLLLPFKTQAASKAKAKKAPTAEEVLQQGREAFLNYKFDEASDLYDEYRKLISKSKQSPDENFETWEDQLVIATNAFGRVQKLEIIDSISLPRNSLFKAYKLSDNAGKIGAISRGRKGVEKEETGFSSSDGDFQVVSIADGNGNLRLNERWRLLDGDWENMEIKFGDQESQGDYAYPFMSGDGQTLYFANNGEESMGGYDLFVVQREPLTGEYLQPLNLGMPFNSPYDDIMLAVDEEKGLGWWATDRNSGDGKIMVYVYKLSDIRENYPPDTPDLIKHARLFD